METNEEDVFCLERKKIKHIVLSLEEESTIDMLQEKINDLKNFINSLNIKVKNVQTTENIKKIKSKKVKILLSLSLEFKIRFGCKKSASMGVIVMEDIYKIVPTKVLCKWEKQQPN